MTLGWTTGAAALVLLLGCGNSPEIKAEATSGTTSASTGSHSTMGAGGASGSGGSTASSGAGAGPLASRVNTPDTDPDQWFDVLIDVPAGSRTKLVQGPAMIVASPNAQFSQPLFTVPGDSCDVTDGVRPFPGPQTDSNDLSARRALPTGTTLCTSGDQYPAKIPVRGFRPYPVK